MRLLPNDIAVCDHDTHISKWVEDSGRLDIAREALECVHRYIRPGSTVIDVGAFIGDHTATYADWVGPAGLVIALEPNQEPFTCLRHNIRKLANTRAYQIALSDDNYRVVTIEQLPNVGASYLKDYTRHADSNLDRVDCFRLDDFIKSMPPMSVRLRELFIKIDAEGYEEKILRGAEFTLRNYLPTMLMEVNRVALFRQGTNPDKLYRLLDNLLYTYTPTDSRMNLSDEQLDVICVPKP